MGLTRILAVALIVEACFVINVYGLKQACLVPLCKKCSAPRRCFECRPFETNKLGVRKWPVFRTANDKCKACTQCPYKQGWATCDAKGCRTCRHENGFRLDVTGTKCECRYEDGFRPLPKGGCTDKPCPNMVQCLVEPCGLARCPKGTKCANDYCGGCGYHCVPDPCPKPVECLIDPCQNAGCPAGTRCEADTCNGECAYRCVREASGCDSPANCLVDPCRFNNCKPWQTCVSDYCKGCSFTCIDKPDR